MEINIFDNRIEIREGNTKRSLSKNAGSFDLQGDFILYRSDRFDLSFRHAQITKITDSTTTPPTIYENETLPEDIDTLYNFLSPFFFRVEQNLASTTKKGIVQEASQVQIKSGTDIGSTGARLYVPPSKLIEEFMPNTHGNTLFVNPLNANASDAWTRTQALGRPEKPFLTLAGAINQSINTDKIVIVSNVTHNGILNNLARHIEILSRVTLNLASHLFNLGNSPQSLRISGKGTINLNSFDLMRSSGWGNNLIIEDAKIIGTGRTYIYTGGSSETSFRLKNCSVTGIIQGNQGGSIIAQNTNFTNITQVSAGTPKPINLHFCTIDGTLNIESDNTGVIANTICSTNPTIPAGIQVFNFTPNVPIILP